MIRTFVLRGRRLGGLGFEALCRQVNATIRRMLANGRMWMGHFDLPRDDDMPLFRHAVPLRGIRGASVELLEDLIEGAVNECERYHPALQFVVWGGKAPDEAMAASLLDIRGEA